MADTFKLDPMGLSDVGDEVAELIARIKAIMGTLHGQIAGEGAGIACAIVSGDANDWHASYNNVQSKVDADIKVGDYWAHYLKYVVRASQQSDQSR